MITDRGLLSNNCFSPLFYLPKGAIKYNQCVLHRSFFLWFLFVSPVHPNKVAFTTEQKGWVPMIQNAKAVIVLLLIFALFLLSGCATHRVGCSGNNTKGSAGGSCSTSVLQF
jgi:hypothetical protein